jgi:hypothetical protein
MLRAKLPLLLIEEMPGANRMQVENSAPDSLDEPEAVWGELAAWAIIMVPWTLGCALLAWAVVLNKMESY